MAYNVGRIREANVKIAPSLSRGTSGVVSEQESADAPVFDLPPQALIEKELQDELRKVREEIDSPRALLIIRNAALTLLELSEIKTAGQLRPCNLDWNSVKSLLSNSQYRQTIVDRLISTSPNFWDENWDHVWSKDAEPLYSEQQQRIVRRRSLISFWTREWQTLPKDQIEHAVLVITSLGAR
jgi:hypothetical protein